MFIKPDFVKCSQVRKYHQYLKCYHRVRTRNLQIGVLYPREIPNVGTGSKPLCRIGVHAEILWYAVPKHFLKLRSAFTKGYVFTCHDGFLLLLGDPLLLHATCLMTWTLVIIIIKTRFLLHSKCCLCISLKDIIFGSNFLQFEIAMFGYIRHLSHLGGSYNTHLPGMADACSSSMLVVTIYEHLSNYPSTFLAEGVLLSSVSARLSISLSVCPSVCLHNLA